jgi:hypothetical protein
MFFGLSPVDDHPCCKMQEVVEAFFLKSMEVNIFSMNLFPGWIHTTLNNAKCVLKEKFSKVHALLHSQGMILETRRAIYEQLRLTNSIEELCDGATHIPANSIDWESPLGIAILVLMSSLYDALDLAVFRRQGQTGQPTHQLYSEFIEKNKYVCPFCGLDKFKNRRGPRREDFDHYLHKSDYPLAASNMRNLVPTCGTCNQDYKKTKDILADGAAFYPYAAIPEIKVEIDCNAYPAPDNFDDSGRWVVKLELVLPDATADPKLKAWNRVYSIKERLENEVQEFFEEWMAEVSDNHAQAAEKEEYLELIASAGARAKEQSHRRMQPGQIIRAAFYDFMLSKAENGFVESFRQSQNRRYA